MRSAGMPVSSAIVRRWASECVTSTFAARTSHRSRLTSHAATGWALRRRSAWPPRDEVDRRTTTGTRAVFEKSKPYPFPVGELDDVEVVVRTSRRIVRTPASTPRHREKVCPPQGGDRSG